MGLFIEACKTCTVFILACYYAYITLHSYFLLHVIYIFQILSKFKGVPNFCEQKKRGELYLYRE